MLRRCLFLVLFGPIATASPAADRPNVLFILSDDQAWTDYGFMGHDTIRTPHLDKLASQGAIFPRAYVPMSLCRPSLATLVTGLYPHQHRISGNDPVFKANARKARYQSEEYLQLNERLIAHIEEHPTVPRLLGQAGYRSLQTGKWWEGNPARGGFTTGMTHGDPQRGARHGDAGLDIGRKGLKPIYDFLDAKSDQPWFIWYAPMLPHTPHTPPDRLLAKYTAAGKSEHIAKYQAMCEWWDETCGELLKAIDDRGLAGNTLVVYVTDNGWLQDPDNPRYAPRSKRSPNEGGIRSPIILRWPGQIEPARHETLVSSIDLAPTILSACGVDVPKSMPGLDLLDICKHAGQSERTQLFGEIFEHDIPDVDDPVKGLTHRWTIEGDWKLILPVGDGAAELYNLNDDPHENQNLAAQNPERVAALTKGIDAWWPIQ
jgi:arylsulfatase A-like enzyme